MPRRKTYPGADGALREAYDDTAPMIDFDEWLEKGCLLMLDPSPQSRAVIEAYLEQKETNCV